MPSMKKATIYVDHVDSPKDFDFVQAWLKKWEGEVHVVDYSTGGWEHIWDIEVSNEALSEIPADWLCSSKWSDPELFEP